MEDSPFARLRRFVFAASGWFLVRLGLFGAAILIAKQLPEEAKGPAWLAAFALGAWAFAAFVREARRRG